MSKLTKGKTNSSDVALKVEHVSKSFRLPTEKANGIKQAFINRMQGKTGYTKQEVLKDISFEVKKGDFFGIVGRNGSGKSTLLKLISQIYTPDSGKITVNGSLVPFIELGVGFNPELTGRENVYLNGAMLGFSKEEIAEMYEEIVEFAELHDFMDQKLKNYSSGMQVRLAFSVAIKARGDILVLDEVLAVGDEAFQKKCNDYFELIRKDKTKTIILVTHSMDSVRKYCNRAMLITDGEITQIGSSDKVASAYSDIFIREQIAELEKEQQTKIANRRLSDVQLQDIRIIQDNKKTRAVQFYKDFTLELDLLSEEKHENLTMGIHFFDQAGRDMLAITTKVFGKFDIKKGQNRVKFDIQNVFTDGNYYINLAIEENDSKKPLVQNHEISPFSVVGINLSKYSKHGLVHPKVTMSHE